MKIKQKEKCLDTKSSIAGEAEKQKISCHCLNKIYIFVGQQQ